MSASSLGFVVVHAWKKINAQQTIAAIPHIFFMVPHFLFSICRREMESHAGDWTKRRDPHGKAHEIGKGWEIVT